MPAAVVRNWLASLYLPAAIHQRASRAASSRPASGSWLPSAQDNAVRMLAFSAESRSDQPVQFRARQGCLRRPGYLQRPPQQADVYRGLLAGGGKPAGGELAG